MGLFGGKSKKQNGGRGARRSRSKKKEPLTAEQVQAYILSAMVEFGNGMEFEKWSAVAGQSFLSIGFDELDTAEVCLTAEELCAVRLPEDGDYNAPDKLFAVIC
ncbi:MAG: hypothetical protein HRU15_13290, partial [Planctomycetes bacterium]|nr:hypothetical protein [Planctomycetota bacterium]